MTPSPREGKGKTYLPSGLLTTLTALIGAALINCLHYSPARQTVMGICRLVFLIAPSPLAVRAAQALAMCAIVRNARRVGSATEGS